MKKHVMIDIETTGTSPGAKILSIGACVFDASGVMDADSFYVKIDSSEYPSNLFWNDQSTMMWWSEQDPAVKQEAFSGETHPLKALTDFHKWMVAVNPDTIWCKGLSFDVPILQYAMDQGFGLDAEADEALTFRKTRCARTYLAQVNVNSKGFITGNAHNALDDAIGQARAMVFALDMLGIGEFM